MSDFFNEVNENVAAEEWSARLKRGLPWILGVVAVIVVATGAFWGWTAWEHNQASKASDAYDRGLKALASQNTAGADAAFAEAAKIAPGAYKALAIDQRAALLTEQNKTADAVKLLDQAADDTGKNYIQGDVYRLKAAWLLLDTAPYAEIEKRMTPLIGKDRPFRSYARETLAMAKLMVPSKVKDARGDFELISVAQDADQGLHRRAQAAIALIDSGAADQLAAVVKAAKTLPPPPPEGPSPFPASGAPAAQSGAPQ